jgi:uncharacterized protein (TIGR00369 family)
METAAPWQEEARGTPGDPAILTLPGLEQLRTMLTRHVWPSAPVGRLTGLRLTAVGAGSCTFVLPASRWLLGPKGRVHTGMLAFLADASLASAVLSALPARVPMTTAELSMTFLGDAPAAGGNLLAQAKLIHSDAGNGLAEVFITDIEGRLVAHGTSRCFIYPPIDLPEMSLSDPAPDAVYDTPDPHLRDGGELPTPPLPSGASGLDILRAEIAGDRPAPPVDQLTGIRPVEADDGRVVFAMPASRWLTSPTGILYGGMVACLAKSAASAAVQTIAGAATTFTALDVKVNYLRPGVVGAGDLVATGTVIHRGRSLAIASAEVVQNGKKIAVATGSTALRSVG